MGQPQNSSSQIQDSGFSGSKVESTRDLGLESYPNRKFLNANAFAKINRFDDIEAKQP